MRDDQLETIERIAEALRSAMEVADFSKNCGSSLRNFPRECCNYASDLLLIFFAESRVDGFTSVLGSRPDTDKLDAGHVWVQRGDLVVDITADQFPGQNLKPVIVGESEWHRSRYLKDEGPLNENIIQVYRRITSIYDQVIATGKMPPALRSR